LALKATQLHTLTLSSLFFLFDSMSGVTHWCWLRV